MLCIGENANNALFIPVGLVHVRESLEFLGLSALFVMNRAGNWRGGHLDAG